MRDQPPHAALSSIAPSTPSATRTRRRSTEVDALRARALRDDPLIEISDSDREWVWRSILKRVRLRQAAALGDLAPTDGVALDAAIARVRARYAHRLQAHHARVAAAVQATPDPLERSAPDVVSMTEAARLVSDATPAPRTAPLPRLRQWLFRRNASSLSE